MGIIEDNEAFFDMVEVAQTDIYNDAHNGVTEEDAIWKALLKYPLLTKENVSRIASTEYSWIRLHPEEINPR